MSDRPRLSRPPVDRPSPALRLLVWLMVVGVATATGMFWGSQRRQGAVDATVRLTADAVVQADGTLEVVEEVVVLEGGDVVQRVLAAPSGVRWGGVVDSTGAPVDHRTVEVVDGLLVNIPLRDGPTAVQLRYGLLDGVVGGRDAAGLAWTVLDDRNALALAAAEVTVGWDAAGWLLTLRRHGGAGEVIPPRVDVEHPPGPERPAEVAWLLRHGIVRKVEDMAATLVDLHARGILIVADDGWSRGAHDGTPLDLHEQVALEWALAGGTASDPDDLVAGTRAVPTGWRAVKRRFETAVIEAGHRHGLLVRTAEDERVVGAGVAAMVLLVAGVAGTAAGQPAWLVAVAVGAAGLVTADAFAGRTSQGAQRAAAWRAFAAHLATVGCAAAHRGYAVALGVPPSGDPAVESIIDTLMAVDAAYLAATSYLAASQPGRRRRMPS
jgi:hypothetical protein